MYPELDFQSSLFVCGAMTVLFLVGYGLVILLGLGVMRPLDRRTGRKKWWVVGRSV